MVRIPLHAFTVLRCQWGQRGPAQALVWAFISYIDMQLPGTKPIRLNVLAGIYTQEGSAQGLGKSFWVIVKKVNSFIKERMVYKL